MTSPTMTCILTSHCKPDYIHEAISSILMQSYTEDQLIVADSGALARSGAFSRYQDDGRVLVITTGETPEMRGQICLQARAINECFRHGLVRGELVCYLSDDDVYGIGIFAAWMEAAANHPDQLAWYGSAERWEVRPEGQVHVGELPTVGVGGLGVSLDNLIDGMQVCHRAGLRLEWPEAIETASHADGVFIDRIGAVAAIHPVTANVGRHRHTPASTFTRPA